jgi:hypothetical protein
LNQGKWPSGPVLRELFHKLERAYVLCEFVHHGNETSDCRVLGVNLRAYEANRLAA